MTTVFYSHKHRVIVSDGQSTHECGMVMSETTKKYRVLDNGEILFLSGHAADYDNYVKAYLENTKVIFEGDGCSGIVVRSGIPYMLTLQKNGKLCASVLDYDEAMGSGGVYALCALDFVDTPEQAMRYAMRKDAFTGGQMYILDLPSMKFLDAGNL